MGSRNRSPHSIQRLTKSMEEQGVVVERRKDGLFLKLPNDETTWIHFTPSDVNADRTIFRKLRRAGVVHPDDPRGSTVKLPDYITKRMIDPASKKRLIDWFIENDFPREVLSQDVKNLWPGDPAKVNRALYHVGFRPEDRPKGKQRRVWIAPEDLLALAPKQGEAILKDNATRPLARPAPGTIGERIAEQMKDKERERVPEGSHPTKSVNRTPAPVEAVVVPSPAHKENIQRQGGIVPKAIPKPRREYTEIERALAAQGKTLADLENKVVEAATSGTAGELVDAQAEHISALKDVVDAVPSVEELRARIAELVGQNDALTIEVEQAMQMASEAEAALAEAKDRAAKAEDLLANVKIPNEVEQENSWVVDLDELLGAHLSRMVGDRLEVVRIAGLEYELRMWRRGES